MNKIVAMTVLILSALPVQARDFSIHHVMGATPRQVDSAIGRPVSVGKAGKFREYGTKRAGWYVEFANGKAVKATVTFRTTFSTPQAALKAIGLEPRKVKPVKTTFLSCRWEKLNGMKSATVRSLDGKLWETVEVEK